MPEQRRSPGWHRQVGSSDNAEIPLPEYEEPPDSPPTEEGTIALVKQRTFDENGRGIRQAARAARSDNVAFLDLASPTNAQTLAQVKSLTRQINALTRLVLNDLAAED